MDEVPEAVRIIDTDGALAALSADDFLFSGRASPLAVAFVSPYVDFEAVAETLRQRAGATPIVAVSTAGELCSTDASTPLYKATGDNWASIVVQIFSPDLLAEASIHAIPLHNEDIRRGSPSLSPADRVERIAGSLADITPAFRLDARDTLGLTFVDGLSACEDYLMEAAYRSGRFPCLFVGGSAGGKLDFIKTLLFDGARVLENHAVIAFVKLAEGKRYGVLKSHNFRKAGLSFVVVDADPDRRTVSTVLDQGRGEVVSFIDALSAAMAVPPGEVMERLTGYTFGIELDGELFVRSVAKMDAETGVAFFFCDIRQGDELHLLQATDFVDQTRRDIELFLDGKPPPLTAILNDCILRRLNNAAALASAAGLWTMPVAGFSTFGELLGININQTLTAIVFFEDETGGFTDKFVDNFPIHYASFCNYFTRRELNRIEVLNRLRSEVTRRLAAGFDAGAVLARTIDALMTRNSDIRRTIEDIHATIAEHQKELERQVAERTRTLTAEIAQRTRIEQALRDIQGRLQAITAGLFEGVLLIDGNGIVVFANKSAHRWLDAEALVERELDEVVQLQDGEGAVRFEDGPFRRAVVTGEATIDDDAVFVTAAGRRLEVAYATSALEEGGTRRMAMISFRGIEALKSAQREASQAARLASVGQLAAGIAHEINTPIQYIGTNLSFVRDSLGPLASAIAEMKSQLDDLQRGDAASRILSDRGVAFLLEELPQCVAESLDGVAHVSHIVQSMREFSHPGSAAKTAVDINRAIDSTITVSRNEWRMLATVETDLAPDLPGVAGFPADLNQVLLNLIVNAAQAIGSAQPRKPGVIRISTRTDGDAVEIRVGDNGPGVPQSIRDKIFDPFFTTKEVGKGTGQGLAICRNMIVNKHGGDLRVDDAEGGGAVFIIRLPLQEREPPGEVAE